MTSASFRIAAITMVRDDVFFLRRWINYYASHFGVENLFVICHGDNPEIRALCRDCNILRVPVRSAGDTIGNYRYNRDRADLVENLGSGLLSYYDFLCYTDVDEFIVLDPRRGNSLSHFIEVNKNRRVLHPLGLEIVHVRSQETLELSDDVRIFDVRKHCRIAARYTKPSLFNTRITWEGGFHHSTFPKLHILDGLYCFHLKWVDYALSIGTHRTRHQNKSGGEAEGDAFPLREKVEAAFRSFENVPVSDAFDFSAIAGYYRRTWRPRAFVFHSKFWKSVVGLTAEKFLIYWRYDRYPNDEASIYRLPDRFSEIL